MTRSFLFPHRCVWAFRLQIYSSSSRSLITSSSSFRAAFSSLPSQDSVIISPDLTQAQYAFGIGLCSVCCRYCNMRLKFCCGFTQNTCRSQMKSRRVLKLQFYTYHLQCLPQYPIFYSSLVLEITTCTYASAASSKLSSKITVSGRSYSPSP